MAGPIKRNQRRCVRCEDEPAQRPDESVFALGAWCLMEVIPKGTHAEQVAQYAELMAKYGWRAA